ncbi:hypothetical protein GGF46_004356 [Coemansia sp. RSA 552]|nr:hypothetical protein GGF46_004356 [Coemansia sp. RSA 552]
MGRGRKGTGKTAARPQTTNTKDHVKPSRKAQGKAQDKAQSKAQGKQAAAPVDMYTMGEEDSDEGNDDLVKRRNLERVGVRDYEVSHIDSEDDEEIDSDDAFNASDEERFRSYKPNGSDQEESDQEESDQDDEADLVDLSEMLDAESSDDEPQQEADDVFAGFSAESSDESGSEGDDEKKLEKLGGFVSSISARAPKRRFVEEAPGGAFAENANAIGSGMHARGVSLGLGDLLDSALGDSTEAGGEEQQARELRAIRDQVRDMERTAKRSGSGVVAAPVAKRLQDQMDRRAAYTQTKKSVSEWQPTVNANRTAEHLSFSATSSTPFVNTRALVGDAGAKSTMEAQIEAVLSQSGMTDEQQRQYEELELKELSPEEIRERQRELRMTRELMFRSEQKAKRMAKIKSKAYRRILKRQKTRAQEQELDKMKEDDPEMYAMFVEKMTQSRAEERMTLRHKNTGKWAKAMRGRHGDEDTQMALREQVDQHDKLRRKIHDIGEDEDVSDYEAGKHNSESDSDDNQDDSFAGVRDRAIREISNEAEAADELPANAPHKALFEMRFMQNAMQRKREEAARDAQLMRDEFESLEAEVDEDGRAISVNRPAAAAKASQNAAAAELGAPGRMSFGGGVKKQAEGMDVELDAPKGLPSKRVRLDGAGQVAQVASGSGHRVKLQGPLSIGSAEPPQESNPWLDEAAAAGNAGSEKGVLSKGSTKIDKLSARLREKRRSKGDSTDVLLDVNKTLAVDKPDDSDDDMAMEHVGKSKNAFSQRRLVEQAFAEDNVVEAEFAAEKQAEMELDAPQDEDLTLPGWGSWSGTGMRPKKNKVVRKAVKGSGTEKKGRLDAKLGSVIINQRIAKGASKYCVSNVPFPFYSAEQYETQMSNPLGKEWNTTRSHSKMIKPRVMTKAGRIIDPLSIPSKKHQ